MIYAIHKTTKEHRVISAHTRCGADEWRYAEAAPDGWIEWNAISGAKSPVANRNGYGLAVMRLAHGGEVGAVGYWDDTPLPKCRVVAYRPILDADTKTAECAECEGVRLTAFGDDCPACCKPEPRAWDGSGMPRDGDLACTSGGECEVVTTDAARGQVCVRWNDGELGVVPIGAVKPRPIRSEEDGFIGQMVSDLADAGCEGFAMKHYARKLYQAGYRKTGGEG